MNNYGELREAANAVVETDALVAWDVFQDTASPETILALLNENERLRKAVIWALKENKERHGSGHNVCSHVSCVLRRALGDAP